jgi:hypothetical protein
MPVDILFLTFPFVNRLRVPPPEERLDTAKVVFDVADVYWDVEAQRRMICGEDVVGSPTQYRTSIQSSMITLQVYWVAIND